MSGPVERVLAKLPGAKRKGQSWIAQCPAHDDRRPSLSIAEGDDGRVLVKCFAGCTPEAIVAAMGLTMRDLMPADAPTVDKTRCKKPRRKVLSTPTPKKAPTTYPTARDAVAELERRHGVNGG